MVYVMRIFSLALGLVTLTVFSHPLPVIVDTDMGFDDWMALIYVAKNPKVELKAVTISCTGETHCDQDKGAINAAKLLTLAGKPNVPVYSGNLPNHQYWPVFPKLIRESATTLNGLGKKFPYNISKVYPVNTAAKAIMTLAEDAAKTSKPITIISIGTSTNIADAYYITPHKRKFIRGIKMVYKGGGSVGIPVQLKNGTWRLTNYHLPGNLSIPGLYATNNTQAEWNIYADAESTETLITNHIPLTFITTNLSDQVPITESSYNRLKKMAGKAASVKFVLRDIESQVHHQAGWNNAHLDYWDPSVVVAALNPELVTQHFRVSACINTRDLNKVATNGHIPNITDQVDLPNYVFTPAQPLYFYGSLLVNQPYSSHRNNNNPVYTTKACDALNEPAAQVNVDTQINVKGFYQNFIAVLSRKTCNGQVKL